MTMQHSTTDGGRTDRRTYLKALGVGALATGIAGLAGCVGAGTGGGGSGGDSGNSDNENGNDGESGGSDGAQNGSPGDSNADTEADTGGDGNSGATSNDAGGFETYTNDDPAFSVKHPTNWVVEDGISGVDFELKSDEISFVDSMVQYTTGLAEPGKVEEDLEISIDKAEGRYKIADGSKNLGKEKLTLPSGQTATTLENLDERYRYKYLFVGTDDIAYEIMFRWPRSDFPEDFSRIIDKVFKSFTIGK